MKIINIQKVNATLRTHIINSVFAFVVTIIAFAMLMDLMLKRAGLFMFALFGIIILFAVAIGTYDLIMWFKLRADLQLLQHSIGPVHYYNDCVCCGEVPLKTFDTIYKTSANGVYLDTSSKVILVTADDEEGEE